MSSCLVVVSFISVECMKGRLDTKLEWEKTCLSFEYQLFNVQRQPIIKVCELWLMKFQACIEKTECYPASKEPSI